MKSKVFLSAVLSAAALTGAVIGTALPSTAAPCIYSDRINSTSASITGDGSGTSGNSIDFTSPNKSGILAAGLAILGFAGSMVLKAQLNKRSAAEPSDVAEAEIPAEIPAEIKVASVFPIEVPAEALASALDRVEESV